MGEWAGSKTLMNVDKNQGFNRNISRREFAGKSIIAAIAMATAGISSYAVFRDKRAGIFLNYHRMGHCAPAVMQTLLDINDLSDLEPVIFSSGMAGGIGGPEMECGALTAPLMFLGYKNGIPADNEGKIIIIRQAQSYINNFNRFNGSTICNNIRNRNENGCRKAVYGFHRAFRDALQDPLTLQRETEESYSLLLSAFADNEFHCSHSLLNRLDQPLRPGKKLYDASWPFLGGIALLNRTCGVLAAGVMVLSYSKASIESSFGRVAVMNKMLKENDPRAMNNEVNEFNMAINAGAELGLWFRKEFGSTTCRGIWGYDFSKKQDVSKYLSGNCLGHCNIITDKVAGKILTMI
jgi:C_GCAxxG_C_C family probable redox protein